MTVLAVACVWASSWAYSWRMARVWRAGPSVWSVQLLGVPLIRNDARSKWPWALASPLRYDVYVGIDVLNSMAGFTFVYNGGQQIFFHHYPSKQKERLGTNQIFQQRTRIRV